MRLIRNIAAPALLIAAGAFAAFALAGWGRSDNTAEAGVVTTMTVTSTTALVGTDATVKLTLAGVPADMMIGYNFSIAYNDVALKRCSSINGATPLDDCAGAGVGTQAGCAFGMTAVALATTGPSPYGGGCIDLTLNTAVTGGACSPGPCDLQNPIIFTCISAGVFPLDLDAGSASWADPANENFVTNAVDGEITCNVPTPPPGATDTPTPTATNTPLPPTSTATPCPGQVCPTATQGAPTSVAFTQTPTKTPTPGLTPTTPGAGTPAATATRTPVGGPGGVLQPPDTGTGGASGPGSMTWIFAALGAGIAATLGLGIYGRRRAAKR